MCCRAAVKLINSASEFYSVHCKRYMAQALQRPTRNRFHSPSPAERPVSGAGGGSWRLVAAAVPKGVSAGAAGFIHMHVMMIQGCRNAAGLRWKLWEGGCIVPAWCLDSGISPGCTRSGASHSCVSANTSTGSSRPARQRLHKSARTSLPVGD